MSNTVIWGFPNPKPVMVDEAGGGSLPYKVYTALVTQDEPNAPIVTVLENTLGVVPVWYYDNIGSFYVESIGTFKTSKTGVITGPTSMNSLASYIRFRIDLEDQVWFTAQRNNGSPDSNGFENTLVEIRVYP